jgi:acetyl esterase/lipase
MAPVDRRLRAWAWLVRRQASVATMSEADVIAAQSRQIPESAVTRYVFGATAPGTQVTGQAVPGPAGDIPVRVYRPVAAGPGDAGARPLILNFHGGGFVFGFLRMSDWLCSRVALTVGAVVVSVDYRLAPRHRFPAAVDDSYAALAWAAGNAASLGAGGPVGVMGESAGGNLAAVLCLLARDRGGPQIRHQVLLYPATDMTGVPDPALRSPFLSGADMQAYRRHYLADADPGDSRASPLLAKDHGGLPPALIQVGEHDPLREDVLRYAAALHAAGVPVRLTEYPGMPHGYLNFPGLCRVAPRALAEICAEQRAALTATGEGTGPAGPADGRQPPVISRQPLG